MQLHHFSRSGTSYRTRIALELKGLDYQAIAVDLVAGEHQQAGFRSLNPQGLVPALQAGSEVFTQSPAIIEWLEERYPEPPLLPSDPVERAQVRALAALIACDVHPLNNKRVLEALRQRFGADTAVINDWAGTWIGAGFDAFVALRARHAPAAPFCWGDAPGLVDCYLVPQLASARRFQVDLSRWPQLLDIESACAALPAFRRALPDAFD